MNAIVNLGIFLFFIVLPAALALAAIWYVRHPDRIYFRQVSRFKKSIGQAVEGGDFNSAVVMSAGLTALLRERDKNAAEFVPPRLESLYDQLNELEQLRTEKRVMEETADREAQLRRPFGLREPRG